MSGSDVTPFIKINKPLVVYVFSKVMTQLIITKSCILMAREKRDYKVLTLLNLLKSFPRLVK